MISFIQKLKNHGVDLVRKNVNILQINVGKMCNQACHHCHVEAGPKRTEIMKKNTIDTLLELLDKTPSINTIDLTGGAPELNPNFKYFVTELKKRNKHIINRCNLTILLENGQENTAEFLAKNNIEICASLPCYLEDNVNKQRGNGVFNKSITALQILNKLGYGKDLILNLVFNPQEINLPPAQDTLEIQYKNYLKEKFGIVFNNLFTITNMPIKRYKHYLKREKLYDKYMQILVDNFNIHAVNNVMCTELVSISWDGKIYDCDFNQMLEINPGNKETTIWNIDNFNNINNKISLANHCYGCTAGAGSSCGGSLI